MKDLLDLCRLNLMEKNIEENCVDPEKESVLKLIDMKKRMTMTRMKHDPSPIAPNAMKEHLERNADYYEQIEDILNGGG